jgi:hypothetical protein
MQTVYDDLYNNPIRILCKWPDEPFIQGEYEVYKIFERISQWSNNNPIRKLFINILLITRYVIMYIIRVEKKL